MLEDLEDVGRPEETRTGLDHLFHHLVDDFATHGVELLGGRVHGRMQPDQRAVHLLAVGEVAEARVVVVAGVGEDRRPERVPVGRERGTGVVIDGDGDGVGEGGTLVGPHHGTHGRVRNHEVELRHGGLDEPAHRRAPLPCAVLVALRHRGEHARQAAEPCQVALTPLVGVHRDLRECRQHVADGSRERVTDAELNPGHGGGPCHAPGETAHEVECLQLCLGQAVLGRLLGPGGDGFEGPCVLSLGLAAEVGQELVVAGKAEERALERIGSEDGMQQFVGKLVPAHRGRLARTTGSAGP